MKQYKTTYNNSKNFSLTCDNVFIGELNYHKWYSCNADILLADNSAYPLKPTGFGMQRSN